MSKHPPRITSGWPTLNTAVAQIVSARCPHSKTNELTRIRDGRKEDYVICHGCGAEIS
jgi:RNA polymerase-binding transcription factor DksA